ncbi:hypothetical protein [Flavobacterium beibuense]|uniref:hypothetical protein n=1 Tax=Flavobacterium beibuense TaxID=657326 RepID=UPI003A9277C3
MPLSDSNLNALMLQIHDNIDSYSNTLNEELSYPPGSELTEEEKEELKKLNRNAVLKSALQKITANNAAEVVFSIFSLLDGVTDPEGEWTGLKLEDINEDEEEHSGEMLHDMFYDSYWDWKENNK